MDIQFYLDEDDFKVEIGQVVMFREEWAGTYDTDKYYTILEMPNLANTVILAECLIGDNGEITDILRESPIEVEPWKIGAI